MINISEPHISQANIAAVLEALNANSVSTYGAEVNKFEELLYNITKFSAIAVNSGTSALELSIDATTNDLGRRSKSIIGFCDYTFIATPNSILNTGNIPLSIPCDPADFSIDIEFFNKTILGSGKLDAIIITLPFGNYNKKIETLINLCTEKSIPVIIDAAASISIDFKVIEEVFAKCNSICLSFNGNKVITSGAGGAVLSSSDNFLQQIRSLISLNRLKNYEHSAPGQNKKMAALNAALGTSQLLELDARVKARVKIYEILKQFSDDFSELGFDLFPSDQYELCSDWIYFLKPKSAKIDAEYYRARLSKKGFNSPRFWRPVSGQEAYRKFILIEENAPHVDYPDLIQLPMTLKDPTSELAMLLDALKGNK